MRITLPSGTTAELARPEIEPSMGLVLVPDIMGLRPLFDEHCARLAREHGFTVCCFELFAGREHLTRDERMVAAKDNDDTRILGDAVAAAAATGCARVGILGFCMGGMYTLKSVRTGRFARTVAFYGMIRVPEGWRGPGQSEPLDAIARGDASTALALMGSADPFTPPDDIAELRAAGVTAVVYDGAEHAFVHDPDRPVHRPADAADAWSRAISWLKA
jgi:carboxymethylenebutenolidase